MGFGIGRGAAQGDPGMVCTAKTLMIAPSAAVDFSGIKAGIGFLKAAVGAGRSVAGSFGSAIRGALTRDAEGAMSLSDDALEASRSVMAADLGAAGQSMDGSAGALLSSGASPAGVGFDAATEPNQGESIGKVAVDFAVGLVPGVTTGAAIASAAGACGQLGR